MEWSVLVLRYFLYLSIKFRSRCLVDATAIGQPVDPYSLKNAQHSNGIHIGSKLGRVKANLYVALGGKIIDFCWTKITDQTNNAHRVTHVRIVKVEIGLSLQMCDTWTIVHTATPNDAMNIITFIKQKLCQITTILPCNTCDKGNFSFFVHSY